MVSAKWFLLALVSCFSATLFAQNPLLDAAKLPDPLETPTAAPAPMAAAISLPETPVAPATSTCPPATLE